MAVTVTTRESWISRLGNSIRGILAGIVLFLCGFPVLFWNEGNSVRTVKALAEGEGACIPLETVESIDPDYEGRLVHATGKADTADVLSDGDFGISETAIRLERQVEMFQWEEESSTTEKKNLGGSVTKTTTYTYGKVWSDRAIDSSDFREAGHDNPGAMEYGPVEREAQNVRLGAFRLNERQISRIGREGELELAADYACPLQFAQRRGNSICIPNAASRKSEGTNVHDVVSNPQIGDMRVSFRIVRPHAISIVSKQRGDTFAAYVAKNGKKVDLLSDGEKDAAEMFAAAKRGNAIMTWLLRLGGFLLMSIGLSMVLKPLSVIGDLVPFVGTVVAMGAGLVSGVVALVCALATIAVAWIFYRPVLGVLLLAAAAALAWWLWRKRQAQAQGQV